MNKKYIFSVLFLCLGMLYARPASASHLLGNTIGWNYLGNDTFLVWVDIYRDCNGVPMQEQPYTVFPCGTGNGVYVNTLISQGMDITPVCKGNCSRCSDPTCSFGQGIEEYHFTAKLNLKAMSSTCCDFLIVWQGCCRGNIITTGSEGEEYYVDASVNICIAPHDNSPVFHTQPVMVFGVEQCQTLDYGATDPDVDANGFADSLVYSFDQPLQAAGTPVAFTAPYAYNTPLLYYGGSPNAPWSPNCLGFHLDSATGIMRFKTSKTDISPVNILVQEYGKDANGKPVLKGFTHRDLNLFSMGTSEMEPDNVPALSGINGSDSFSTTLCAGANSCFYIDVSDADLGDSDKVSVFTSADLSNATIEMGTNTKHPRTVVCWKPAAAAAGKSFQLVINAVDNACPISGHSSMTYTINVGRPPAITMSYNNQGCGNIQFVPATGFASPATAYAWTGDDGLSGIKDTIMHHYRSPGAYKYHLLLTNPGGCTDSTSGTVTIAPYVTMNVHPRDTLFCLAGATSVTVNTNASGGVGPYTYAWYSGPQVLNYTGASLTLQVAHDTTLVVFVKDNGANCTNWDTVKIKATRAGTPVSLIPPANTTFCLGQQALLAAKASGGDSAHYRYTWKLNGNQTVSPDYGFKATNAFSLMLTVTDGCTSDSAQVSVTIRPPLKITLSPSIAICAGDYTTLKASGTGGLGTGYRFLWGSGQDTGQTFIVNPYATTIYSATLKDGCSPPVSATVTVTVNPEPVAAFTAAQTSVSEYQTFQFYNHSTGAATYSWNFGDGSSASTVDSPYHSYADTGMYTITLTATNSLGCAAEAQIKRYIHVLPVYRVYIPNAFTPNSDSLNDCFQPNGQAIRNWTLEVYSRYGNTVYKGTCWDGTYKGVPMMEGMYIYYLTVTDILGIVHTYSGPVYLIIPKSGK